MMVAALWVAAAPEGLEVEAEAEAEAEGEVEVEVEVEVERELGLRPAPPHPDAAMTTAASRTGVRAHFPIMLSRSETGTGLAGQVSR